MSSVGQGLGMVVGAVVGFYAGGNVALGASIGGAIGGYLDPPKGANTEVGKIENLAQQTAAYGVDIPHGHASHVYGGNCFWIENGALKEVATEESAGGKGGGGPTVTTYSYYFTGAFSLCKCLPGQTKALRRLWLGGRLYYDAGSNDYGAIVASNASAGSFTFYNGSSSQMPDDRMQATLGAGNVPGYRDLCCIVFKDFGPLADYGNTVLGLQIKVELVDATYASATTTLATFPEPDQANPFELSTVRFTGDKVVRTNLIHDASNWTLISTQVQEAHYTADAMETYRGDLPPYSDSWWTTKISCFAMQSDEDSILLQMFKAATQTKLVKFDSAGTLLFETDYIQTSVLPWTMLRCIMDRGKIYMIEDGEKVYQVDATGVVASSSATYDANFAGASENYLFLVSKNVASATVYKLARSDLSLVDTYTAAINSTTTLISVESDDVFYTMANSGVSNRPVYRWENGTASDTGLRYSGYFDSAFTRLHAESATLAYVLSTVGGGDQTTELHALHMAMTPQTVDLADVIEAECLQSPLLTAGDLDTSEISATVRGYNVSGSGSIRGALEPLQAVWPFDVIPSGYQIKFVPRGTSPVVSIASGELDARSSGEAPGVRIERVIEMDSQLPQRVIVDYVDWDREYDPGPPGIAFRKNTDTVSTRNVNLSVVLTADEANGVAEMLLRMYWIERDQVSFIAPPTRRAIEAGDVVTIVDDNASFDVRLTEVERYPDNRVRCVGKFASAPIYSPVQLGQAGLATGAALTLDGDSLAVPLDIPCLLSTQNTYGYPLAMAGYLSGWPGGTLLKSDDQGQTWSAVEGFLPPAAKIGFAINAITSVDTRFKDISQTLTAHFYGGAELSSVTELQMSNGSNHFAYGSDGRWEIVAAQTCVEQGDGSWILSDMLHGRFGTEWAISLHLPYDRLVLLDQAALHFIESNLQAIGADKLLRAVTKGRNLDQAGNVAFSYDAVNLKPLSPCDLNGHRDPTSGDWTVKWTPRSRLPVEPFSGLATPLGESSESYDAEVWDATFTTLKRSFSGLTSPTFQYTTANETTDFGTTQSALPIKVRMRSSIVGLGTPLVGFLTRSRSSMYDLLMFGLHGDGTNGSTVFSDYTSKTFTGNGNAQISTAIATAFSGASIKLDGTGDYLSTPYHVSFDCGTNKAALRFRIYILGNSVPSAGVRHATIAAATSTAADSTLTGWGLYILGDASTTGTGIAFETYGGSSKFTSVKWTGTVTQSAWHWIEVDIDAAGNRYLFLDGTLLTTSTTNGGGGAYLPFSAAGNPLYIGRTRMVGNLSEFYGHIEEAIGVNGDLLNTTTHTPPAVPF